MYMGIDLGTSGIKVILTDVAGTIIDSASASITVSRPHALWSEQNPHDWLSATHSAIANLAKSHSLSNVKAIGIAGQMHGATLLDENHQVLRPAILWNDGRSEAQCKTIESMVSNSREITGNLMMPGFTAPKLLWVKDNEPEIFAKTAKVLLPKDYLRFLLSGDLYSDMSDAAGTLWLNTEKRCWDESLLNACGLSEKQMPQLCEGSDISGRLSASIAKQWGMDEVPIVGGAGDNAAGAIGVGLVKPGQAMISLGTSGVYFVVTDGFCANPNSAVHSFCHALPNTWHLMSVLLSAASCLQWYADNLASKSVEVLLNELNLALSSKATLAKDSTALFLPYLSGERTPHNNPHATGSFFGLTHETTQEEMTLAVLEGVSFAFADAVDALEASFSSTQQLPDEITLIGGGARSEAWRSVLSNVLNRTLTFREGGEVGPGLGAARLAQLAIDSSKTLEQICPQPAVLDTYYSNREMHQFYKEKRRKFQALYQATKDI
ncbi:xylulokinase [Glaciecola sp. MH2013]|uniref:xylulokinase n=1 Tax=Glaciecola sp. MH2013 TaxID=2785524 RepID=UPI00189CCA1A|nr:xylulokinase [Glaciecola sp. MH2013]MBF7073902.1 xylulokinase [Glaciecola sp. MH2013]